MRVIRRLWMVASIVGLFPVVQQLDPVAGVRVSLAPGGDASVPQGAPLQFGAIARNQDPGPVTVDVYFEIAPVEPIVPAVRFSRWTVTIPGSGMARTRQAVVPAQWFEQVGAFEVSALVDGQPAAEGLVLEVLPPVVLVPRFEDVTASAGLDTTLPFPACIRHGSGAAWGDADADGDLDLYVPAQDAPAQLWIHDGAGGFAEEAAERGADNRGSIGMGATFVDYDNDRDQDLYVVNDGPNRLYRNDGAGRFTDVAALAGVDDRGSGPGASWGDYDGDGYLDLYVVNYRNCAEPLQLDGLYHNEGDGTFADRTALLERDGSTIGAGFQATWFDYDADGDQDVYLANDHLPVNPNPNLLWRNDGPGPGEGWVFTDVSGPSGTGYAMNSMGTAVGDVDRDLDLDLAVSNIGATVLARNGGDGTFTEVAGQERVGRPLQFADVEAITWGLGFHDFNLDGWEDLYVAAGPLIGPPPDNVQPNAMFVNGGPDRHFFDLSAPSGADDPGISRGVAFADFDRDGLVDLYVVNVDGSPRLYRNVTPVAGRHWLEVRTVGTASNRDGCGARVLVTAAGHTMVRQVFCGSTSLASGSDAAVHFGLGSASAVSRLAVLWPSGTIQVIRDVVADRLVTVTEPAG